MRPTILFILFSPLIMLSEATAQYKVRGKITDNKGMPVLYATIELMRDSAVIQTCSSDSVGNYAFTNIQAGPYRLAGSYLGNRQVQPSFLLVRDTMVNIRYTAGTDKVLQGVTVTSRRPLIEKKIDRLVFNVENSIVAAGGDATDVLKVTPLVKVKEDAITMTGKSGMAVMVNDRLVQLSGEDLINYLRAIRMEQIKTIEIITNPPAKYDAEGNNGIVNIILKKVKSDSWNASLTSSYKQATYATYSNGGSFTYQKNKLSFYADVNYTKGSKKGVETEYIPYSTGIWNNDFVRRVYANLFSIRSSLDYQLSDRVSIGVQYLGSFNKPETGQLNKTTVAHPSSNLVDSVIDATNNEKKKINSNAINLHSVVKIDTLGRSISFDLDYFDYNNNISRNFVTQSRSGNGTTLPGGFNAASNTGGQNLNIYSFKTDVKHPFSWVDLSYGAKIYFSKTDYNNAYYGLTSGHPVLDPARSNHFIYDENMEALYASGRKQLSKKWELQLGLRLENTQTKGNSVTLGTVTTNNYSKLFPTGYLQYTANEQHTFSLSYGRRLSRPRFNELNPFRVYYSTYSYTQGNPMLIPAYTSNIELQHSYKEMLTTIFSYSKTTNGIGNPPLFDTASKVSYLIDMNYYTTSSWNVSEIFVFNGISWWESENELNVFYNKTSTNRDLHLQNADGYGLYFSTNNNFSFNKSKTFRGEVNFWYQSPQFVDIYKQQDAESLDIGLSYSFLKRSLQAALVVQDLLRTNKDRAATNSGGIAYRYTDYPDRRFFRFTLTYKIGSQKVKARNQKFGNESEKNRAD
ncbi:TonB-dependent receptor domain-containing protein [Chitinophaga sancti]|uniref:TonB-dependent receptor domain-containing protein n=1 Tax=Chitinophaga sancti TaxID=1004 RepID=UPI003F792921